VQSDPVCCVQCVGMRVAQVEIYMLVVAMLRYSQNHAHEQLQPCSLIAQLPSQSCSGTITTMLRYCHSHAHLQLHPCSMLIVTVMFRYTTALQLTFWLLALSYLTLPGISMPRKKSHRHAQVQLQPCSDTVTVMLRCCYSHAQVQPQPCSGILAAIISYS
jgi:hypothetical protein